VTRDAGSGFDRQDVFGSDADRGGSKPEGDRGLVDTDQLTEPNLSASLADRFSESVVRSCHDHADKSACWYQSTTFPKATADFLLGSVPAMKRPVVNAALGQRVKEARKALGLTQGELADRVGDIGQSLVAEIEAGRIARPGRSRELARALQITEDELLGEAASDDPAPIPRTPGPASNAGAPEYVQFASAPLIPVFGQAAGGYEGRFEMNGQKIADVFCPPPLVGIRGAYAVYVFGDSMEPRYFAGETVWLHPYLPVRKGDFVVAQIRGKGPGEPLSAYVKQFLGRSSNNGLKLKSLNPGSSDTEVLTFPDDDVFSIHKIVFSGQS
jgi:phage repressor protein C with HTH and peptisase S24 domain